MPMSEADSTQASTLQRPTTKDRDLWRAYWREQRQPWRTEPEIDSVQQAFLTENRARKPP